MNYKSLGLTEAAKNAIRSGVVLDWGPQELGQNFVPTKGKPKCAPNFADARLCRVHGLGCLKLVGF